MSRKVDRQPNDLAMMMRGGGTSLLPAAHRHRPQRLSTQRCAGGLHRGLPLLLVCQGVLGVYLLLYLRGGQDGLRAVPTNTGPIHQGMEMRAVASDTGSWNALAPVVVLALDRGAMVSVHLSGASARSLLAGALKIDPRAEVVLDSEAVVGQSKIPHSVGVESVQAFVGQVHDVGLVATSASAEGTKDAIAALCSSSARQSLSIVEDMYRVSGGILAGVVRNCPERVAAMRMCTPDPVSQRLAQEKEPGAAAVQLGLEVLLCGGPQFDETSLAASQDGQLASRREGLRGKLGLAANVLMILAVGQVHGTTEMANLLVDGLQAAKEKGILPKGGAAILLKLHPRADEDDRVGALAIKKDHPGWFSRALERFADELGPVSSEDLLPAADIVISGHSTVNYHGILWGMPGVVYLGTEAELEQMKKEKGLEVQPEAEFGAAWRAADPSEFCEILRHLSLGDGGRKVRQLKKAQGEFSKANDGHAAARVLHYVVMAGGDTM